MLFNLCETLQLLTSTLVFMPCPVCCLLVVFDRSCITLWTFNSCVFVVVCLFYVQFLGFVCRMWLFLDNSCSICALVFKIVDLVPVNWLTIPAFLPLSSPSRPASLVVVTITHSKAVVLVLSVICVAYWLIAVGFLHVLFCWLAYWCV